MAAALVATLLVADLGLRAADDRLSGNLAHVARIPAIMQRAGAATNPRSTLLLGNSLMNNGVDAEALAQALSLPSVGKINPDGTSFWDWKCILDHQLLERAERKVARVVVGAAWHLLSDETRADPSRLGALFCETHDIAKPANVGITTPGNIGEFLAARALRLYALRDTLRNGALGHVIPNYKRFASEENAVGQAVEAAPREAAAPHVSYLRLAEMAQALRARGTELVVLAMPVRSAYELDAQLTELSASGAIRLLDYRHLPTIDSTSFVDEMHLGPRGRAVLTAQLALDLAAAENAVR